MSALSANEKFAMIDAVRETTPDAFEHGDSESLIDFRNDLLEALHHALTGMVDDEDFAEFEEEVEEEEEEQEEVDEEEEGDRWDE